MTNFNLREQLVRRMRKLPDSAMPHLEEAIRALEQDQSTLARNLGTSIKIPANVQTEMTGDGEPVRSKCWPHAPVHQLSEHGSYLVTAGTLDKQHFFRSNARLTFLEEKLLALALQFGWQLEAWAVFPNHYHFVAHATGAARSMKTMLSHLHTTTASAINIRDQAPERQVWHNYWDTKLTIETSYFARLNYVHQNAVKHGLVVTANQYPWCSAAWFERTASRAQVQTIYSFATSKVRVYDDF
jgi:putative transposase